MRRALRAGTSSLAPKPAASTVVMQVVRRSSERGVSRVIIAFSKGRLTFTLATPSTFDSTPSTDATHAAQVMPLTLSESSYLSTVFTSVVVAFSFLPVSATCVARATFPFLPGFGHAHASATAGAQPTNAVPSLAAVRTDVEAFHLAATGALLSDDACHDWPSYVVNINPLF